MLKLDRRTVFVFRMVPLPSPAYLALPWDYGRSSRSTRSVPRHAVLHTIAGGRHLGHAGER